jgi:hypothetical protein
VREPEFSPVLDEAEVEDEVEGSHDDDEEADQDGHRAPAEDEGAVQPEDRQDESGEIGEEQDRPPRTNPSSTA